MSESKPSVEIGSIEMVLLWKAIRHYLAKTADEVEQRECRELLRKLGAKNV